MMINLELYRVFYIVAKNGSLTKAKEELFISQPAVSQAIKQLETQLGGKLFIRTSKGMELTGEGKVMYEYVKQACNLISIAEHKFSQMKGLEFGDVVIGASDTVSKFYLLKFVKEFREKYKDINVKINNCPSEENLSLLKSGKLDMCFINSCGTLNDSAIHLTDCIPLQECFVASPAEAAKIDHPLTAPELASKELIMLDNRSSTRKYIEEAIQAQGGTVKPTLELSSVDLIVEFAKIGMGIACVTKEFVKAELEKGELVEIPTTFSLPKRSIALAEVKGLPLSFAAKKFADMVLKKKEK